MSVPLLTVPRLTVELVPSTCWYTNVRSNVTRRQWEACKTYVRDRSGNRCEVCGGRGPRWPVECHEVWEYDDQRKIQTLVDLVALCPDCHACKHIGFAEVRGRLDDAATHLAGVNEWNEDQVVRYLGLVFNQWRRRSTEQWELDISFLTTLDLP